MYAVYMVPLKEKLAHYNLHNIPFSLDLLCRPKTLLTITQCCNKEKKQHQEMFKLTT